MAWVKGQSGNPSGRPKGAAGLARYIAERTSDGQELVDRLLDLSRSADGPVRERVGATLALLDRLIGKPHSEQTMTIVQESTSDRAVPEDFDTWDPARRDQWIAQRTVRQVAPS